MEVDPLAGVDFATPALVMGCLGALPIFVASVLLEKSGVDFFRKIDQDTKLYVIQVFGAQRNLLVRDMVLYCGNLVSVFLLSLGISIVLMTLSSHQDPMGLIYKGSPSIICICVSCDSHRVHPYIIKVFIFLEMICVFTKKVWSTVSRVNFWQLFSLNLLIELSDIYISIKAFGKISVKPFDRNFAIKSFDQGLSQGVKTKLYVSRHQSSHQPQFSTPVTPLRPLGLDPLLLRSLVTP